jgi:hypothetical protein
MAGRRSISSKMMMRRSTTYVPGQNRGLDEANSSLLSGLIGANNEDSSIMQ